MKQIYRETGSYKDFDESKVESAIKIAADTTSWETIAEAANRETGTEDYTAESVAELAPDYIRIYNDGVVILHL